MDRAGPVRTVREYLQKTVPTSTGSLRSPLARLIVPVSMRTMKGTVRPAFVVVIATSGGIGLAGFNG